MRCDWQNDKNAPSPCHVVNLDTGEALSPCAMADDGTGEYVQYVYEDRKSGKFKIDPNTRKVVTRTGKANIEIRLGVSPSGQN